jgi:hypothetical protein
MFILFIGLVGYKNRFECNLKIENNQIFNQSQSQIREFYFLGIFFISNGKRKCP